MEHILAAIGIHGPLAAVVLGAVLFMRSHTSVDEKHHAENIARFRSLEVTRREDLQRVYDAIQHTADQNTEILKLLARRGRD